MFEKSIIHLLLGVGEKRDRVYKGKREEGEECKVLKAKHRNASQNHPEYDANHIDKPNGLGYNNTHENLERRCSDEDT